MPSKPCAILSAALLTAFVAPVGADPIQRATAWEWAEGNASPTQSCEVGTFEWKWDDDFPNRAYYEDYGLWGEVDGARLSDGDGHQYHRQALLPHDIAVTVTDNAGTSRTALAYQAEPLREDGSQPGSPWVSASSLRDAANADEAWLETTVTTWETFYDADAVADLLLQWVRHWCKDKDDDGYCDPVAEPNGTVAVAYQGYLPPMKAAERAELARCLGMHDGRKLQTVRREYQIAGNGNWPEQLLWGAECPHEAPTRPTAETPLQGSSAPSNQQTCALFHQYLDDWLAYGNSAREFLGDGDGAYLCDPARSPVDWLGAAEGYNGYQVRYWAEEARGPFYGFVCPETEEATSALSSSAMRFDTTGLRGSPRAAESTTGGVGAWRTERGYSDPD